MAKKRNPGRPPKKASERRGEDLRIPVTREEKALITKAVAKTERGEIAEWARQILLAAAQDKIADSDDHQTGRDR